MFTGTHTRQQTRNKRGQASTHTGERVGLVLVRFFGLLRLDSDQYAIILLQLITNCGTESLRYLLSFRRNGSGKDYNISGCDYTLPDPTAVMQLSVVFYLSRLTSY